MELIIYLWIITHSLGVAPFSQRLLLSMSGFLFRFQLNLTACLWNCAKYCLFVVFFFVSIWSICFFVVVAVVVVGFLLNSFIYSKINTNRQNMTCLKVLNALLWCSCLDKFQSIFCVISLFCCYFSMFNYRRKWKTAQKCTNYFR